MKASEELKRYIKSVEYFRLTTQKDQNGRWLIGYGTETGALPNRRINLKEADELLDKELDILSVLVENMKFGELTEEQSDVIIRLCMLFGVRSFRASKLYRCIKNGEPADVIEKEIERFVGRDESKYWSKKERIEWLCASWRGTRHKIEYTYQPQVTNHESKNTNVITNMKKNQSIKLWVLKNWKFVLTVLSLCFVAACVGMIIRGNQYPDYVPEKRSVSVDSLLMKTDSSYVKAVTDTITE